MNSGRNKSSLHVKHMCSRKSFSEDPGFLKCTLDNVRRHNVQFPAPLRVCRSRCLWEYLALGICYCQLRTWVCLSLLLRPPWPWIVPISHHRLPREGLLFPCSLEASFLAFLTHSSLPSQMLRGRRMSESHREQRVVSGRNQSP